MRRLIAIALLTNLQRIAFVQAPFSLYVRLVRLFWSVVYPDIQLLTRSVYSRRKASGIGYSDTEEPAGIVRSSAPLVLHIHGIRNVAKILYPVVLTITVPVVNFLSWPRPVRVKPSENMRQNSVPVDRDADVPAADGAGNITSFISCARNVRYARKDAGIWIVYQKFAQTFWRKITGSHAASSIGVVIRAGAALLTPLRLVHYAPMIAVFAALSAPAHAADDPQATITFQANAIKALQDQRNACLDQSANVQANAATLIDRLQKRVAELEEAAKKK